MLKKIKKYPYEKQEEIFDQEVEQVRPYAGYDAAINAYTAYRTAAKQRQQAYKDLYDRKNFSYNVNNDALYDQIVRDYAEGASRAAEDAMGRAAVMTGGYGNSYAQQVGQQTYQDYMGGLDAEADKLYDRALDRYVMQGELLRDKYALASDLADQKYAEYEAILGAKYAQLQDAKPEDKAAGNTTGSAIDFDKYDADLGAMETQEDVEAYLMKRVNAGVLTEQEAFDLLDAYATELPTKKDKYYADRNAEDYEVVDDGGFNVFGMDRNAKVKYTFEDGSTETLTLAQLYEKLQQEGKSKEEAKRIVLDLQESLGISTPGMNIY